MTVLRNFVDARVLGNLIRSFKMEHCKAAEVASTKWALEKSVIVPRLHP